MQATPGKKAIGLKVTDLQGNRISFGRATGRYFAEWITGMTFYRRLRHGRLHAEAPVAARHDRGNGGGHCQRGA